MRPEAIRSFTVSAGICRSCSVRAARSFSTGTSRDARRSNSSLISLEWPECNVRPWGSPSPLPLRPRSNGRGRPRTPTVLLSGLEALRELKGDAMKIWAARVFMVGVMLIAVTAGAQETPSGKVSIESKSVAVGIGVNWGDGKLTYQGKDHSFTISGLSVADVGISKMTTTGNVYHLKKLADFSGNYAAAEAGAAVGTGRAAIA